MFVCLFIDVSSLPFLWDRLVLQVTMAIGAGRMAAEHHTIVTRISALQDIASMEVLCSDKTGTLTTAKMSINLDKIFAVDEAVDVVVGGSAGMTDKQKREYIMAFAMLAANADKKGDAIDGGVIRAFATACEETPSLKAFYDGFKQDSLTGFNPEVKRTVATLTRKSDGKKFYIAKGLATKILDTSAGGKDEADMQWVCTEVTTHNGFTSRVETIDEQFATAGYKTIAICVSEDDGTGKPLAMHFAGLLPMIDPPRHDTAQTIYKLVQAGVEVKMITGDHLNIAKETARLIGMNTNIQKGEATRVASYERDELVRGAGGFAQVLPKDKRECVQVLQKSYDLVVGMTGDGVNDAPALSAAQCGIAVDDATDAAKNAAAMILTSEGLSAVYGAVVESRKIAARLQAYVSFRLATTIQILVSLTIVILVFNCEMNTLYVILLALLNDLTMIPIAEDRQTASAKPMIPNVNTLLAFALIMGTFQAIFTLIFFGEMKYWVTEDKLGPNNRFNSNKYAVKHYFHSRGSHRYKSHHDDDDMSDSNQDLFDNMVKAEHGTSCNYYAQNALWLQISISAELLIYVTRAPGLFFFSMPSIPLLISTFFFGIVLCSLLARFAFPGHLEWADIFKIWAYDLVVMILCDFMKLAFKAVFEHDTSGIIDESMDVDEGDDQVDDSHENRSSVMGAPSNMTVKARDATNRMSRFGDADVSRTSVVERVSEFLTEGKVSKGAPPATLAGHYVGQQQHDNKAFQAGRSSLRSRSGSTAR